MTPIAIAMAAAVLSAAPAKPVPAAGGSEILIIESDGPHGSTTFKDTSRRAHPVVRVGNAHHSSKQKRIGRSSIYFDGRGGHLWVKDTPAFSFGVDDFAVEFWFRPEGAGRRFICGQSPANGADAGGSPGVAIEADGRLRATARSAGKTHLLYASAEAYGDGGWHHVSFRRTGDELRLLVDGQEHDRTAIGPIPLNDSVEPFSIGRSGRFASGPYRGFLDRFVIIRRPRRVPEF